MFSETEKLRMKGYVLHDGGPCPVTGDTRPGVTFVDGTVVPRGTVTADQIDWSRVSGWKVMDRTKQAGGLAFGSDRSAKIKARLRERRA